MSNFPQNFGPSLPGLRGLTATGTNQATAFAISIQKSVFSTVGSGTGAILPSPGGFEVSVINQGAHDLLVYPAHGDQIADNGVNTAVTVKAGDSATFLSLDNVLIAQPRTWYLESASSSGGGGGGSAVGPAGTMQSTDGAGAFTASSLIDNSTTVVPGAFTFSATDTDSATLFIGKSDGTGGTLVLDDGAGNFSTLTGQNGIFNMPGTVALNVGGASGVNVAGHVNAKGLDIDGVPVSGGSAPPGTSALIASAIGVDLNTAGDTVMTLSAFATGLFKEDYTIIKNPSAALDNVAMTISSGAGGTGEIYATIGAGDFTGIPVSPGGFSQLGQQFSGIMQNTAPIISVSVPQGSAATADFYMFGRVFT